jgi:single-strand DNA-binding protein
MARSYCRVQILGYVGGDPKFKQLQNGTTTASIRVATNESYRKEGQVIEQSEWHRAVAFGKLAEFVRDKVRKGDRVLFDGKLHTFAWEDHDKGTSGEQTNIIISDLTLTTASHNSASADHVERSGRIRRGRARFELRARRGAFLTNTHSDPPNPKSGATTLLCGGSGSAPRHLHSARGRRRHLVRPHKGNRAHNIAPASVLLNARHMPY